MSAIAHKRVEAVKQQLVASSVASNGRASIPPSLDEFPYQLSTATRFGDCDMYGHVNNVVYYSYFDTIVNKYLMDRCGMKQDDPVVGVVVASSCEYSRSVNFPQDMIWGLRVQKLGHSSVTYQIGIFTLKPTSSSSSSSPNSSSSSSSTGGYIENRNRFPVDLCALGSFTHVFVTRPSMRPVTIPSAIRDGLFELSPAFQPQSARVLLMVKPVHFQWNQETAEDNAFMQKLTHVTPEEVAKLACREFDGYVSVLESHGIQVRIFHPPTSPSTPDAVYPNNWISTHRRIQAQVNSRNPKETSKLVLYPMKHPSRRLERNQTIISTLYPQYDSLIDFTKKEQENVIFEGTGSAIIDHQNRILYHSLSERSNPKLSVEVASALWRENYGNDFRVETFDSFDKEGKSVYHTNVVMALGSSWAVLCTESIQPVSRRQELVALLQKTGKEVVEVSLAQSSNFCANILEVQNSQMDKFIVMSSRAFNAFTEKQKQILLKHCKKILHTNLDMIETIGGGGARCMIAELY